MGPMPPLTPIHHSRVACGQVGALSGLEVAAQLEVYTIFVWGT